MFGAIDNRYRPSFPRWHGQVPTPQDSYIVDRGGATWWWNGATWIPLDRDPYIRNVVALAHAGVAGVEGPKNYGSGGLTQAYIGTSTEFRKFQNASWRVTNAATIEKLVFNSNAAYAIGTADFTIEFWLYVVSGSTANLWDSRPNTSTNGFYPVVYYAATNSIRYYVNSADRITGANGTLPQSQWNHIAVARAGSSTKLFVNGVQAGSTYSDSSSYLQSAHCVGNTPGTVNNGVVGYIEEPRFTVGVCRYTAAFTPPDKPFSNY